MAAPITATNEAVLTTAPPPRASRWGMPCLQHRNTAVRLTSWTCRQASRLVSSTDVVGRGDAGVVEQHVDAAEALGRPLVHGGHLGLVAHVRVQVQPLDLGRHLLAGLVGQVDHADPRPLGREPPGARPPDPTGRPGNDGHLALEPTDLDRPPLCPLSRPSMSPSPRSRSQPRPVGPARRCRATCNGACVGAPFGVPVLVVEVSEGGAPWRRTVRSPSLAREAIGLREVLFQSITPHGPGGRSRLLDHRRG